MKNMSLNSVPATDAEAIEYLPDHHPIVKASARGLYDCLRAQGVSITESLEEVYCAALGKPSKRRPREAATGS